MEEKLYICGECNKSSTEKEWRATTKEYCDEVPYLSKCIGNPNKIFKEFCCPKCFNIITVSGIQLDGLKHFNLNK